MSVIQGTMKRILIHLGIMGAIVAVLAVGTLWYLDIYTKHNSELIEVQNMEGENARTALRALRDAGLEGVVTDTVYKDGARKNAVINQNPDAGLMVKTGRKVYLVVNTSKVPMVEVPDLAGKTSLTQAKNMLIRKHLKVGKIIKEINESVRTKSDEPVLAQYYSGTSNEIAPKTLIERNSTVDLVIGISSDYYESDSIALSASDN
jgi:beta-lactam-binding protein with PASTA domain